MKIVRIVLAAKPLDEISDLIDTIESTGQLRAKEITRCPDCSQWKIPRYDSKTGRVTTVHVCGPK